MAGLKIHVIILLKISEILQYYILITIHSYMLTFS